MRVKDRARHLKADSLNEAKDDTVYREILNVYSTKLKIDGRKKIGIEVLIEVNTNL